MQQDQFKFGEFIQEHRKNLGITLRGLATQLTVTPAYMSDIEKGRRYAPDSKLEALASILKLTSAEREEMLDLAARTRVDQVSADLSGYIMETDMARVALRRARDVQLDDDGWEKIIQVINGSDGTGE